MSKKTVSKSSNKENKKKKAEYLEKPKIPDKIRLHD